MLGCVYNLYTAAYLEFKATFGAYVQCYNALRTSSHNQQQHLESGGFSEKRCEYDCQYHHNGGNLTCGIRFYQDFGMFNSLRNTLTDSRSNMSLSLCLLVMLMKQHLDMYTYKVKTQQRRR